MAPAVVKSLSKLSRESLVDLCLKWTDAEHAVPYLASNRNQIESDEEDYLHEPAEDVAHLKNVYKKIQIQYREERRDGGKEVGLSKKDIVDRIVDGDWRRGLSLQQLADVDFANLVQNDTALRWSALKLVSATTKEDRSSCHPATKKRKTSHRTTHSPAPSPAHYPTVSPAHFVANLKSHIGPLVKAHYSLHRIASASNLAVVRLYIIPNTPFAPLSSNIPRNGRQATDAGRMMYIAMPDSCPYIYVSLNGGSTGTAVSRGVLSNKSADGAAKAKIDMAATKRIILEAIPQALSKPQERWSLQNTKLTCRSLKAMGLLRGNRRPGTAGGCYSKFSEEYEWTPGNRPSQPEPPLRQVATEAEQHHDSIQTECTPLTVSQPRPVPDSHPPSSQQSTYSSLVSRRFGSMTLATHARIDRFHLTLNDLFAPPTNSPATDATSLSSALQSQPTRKAKRKRRSLEDIEAGRATPVEPDLQPPSEPASITLTFNGVDVFRGMKELALHDGGRYVDLDRLPAWATGEKGVSGLVV